MDKLVKTTITIEVLSEEGEYYGDIFDLVYDTVDGHFSGIVSNRVHKELTPKQMAKALQKQGSDPEFFNLDEDGNKVEDY